MSHTQTKKKIQQCKPSSTACKNISHPSINPQDLSPFSFPFPFHLTYTLVSNSPPVGQIEQQMGHRHLPPPFYQNPSLPSESAPTLISLTKARVRNLTNIPLGPSFPLLYRNRGGLDMNPGYGDDRLRRKKSSLLPTPLMMKRKERKSVLVTR